jgi:hypothetical protein
MLRAWPVLLDGIEIAIVVDVASAATVSQLAGGVLDIRGLAFLVRALFVISGVTAGTVWLERRVTPGQLLRVALVTFCALQVATMILGFIRQGRVTIISRHPCVRYMARIAFFGGAKVIRILAGSDNAIVTG